MVAVLKSVSAAASTVSTHSRLPLRIAVIGAGPVGLTLASILQKKQRDATHQLFTLQVFEADVDASVRNQGGQLDLRQESGLKALAAAGLLDQFHKVARPEGQDMLIANKHRDCLHHEEPVNQDDPAYHPEIGRPQLNQLLRVSIAPGTIQWNHKLLSLDHAKTCKVLRFADGKSVEADLVVGADGAWSRIRPHLSSAQPAYTGVTFIDCPVHDFDAQFPDLVPLIKNGSFYSFSDNKILFAQRNDHGVVRVYPGLRVPEHWHKTSDVATAATNAERIQLLLNQFYRDWHPDLQQLLQTIATSPSDTIMRPIYKLPVGHAWTHRPGLTLVGDAAHLMSPCAGEGVNMGMVDALGLADAIVSSCQAAGLDESRHIALELSTAVARFEAEMFARAGEAAKRSERNMNVFFSPKTADKTDVQKLFKD